MNKKFKLLHSITLIVALIALVFAILSYTKQDFTQTETDQITQLTTYTTINETSKYLESIGFTDNVFSTLDNNNKVQNNENQIQNFIVTQGELETKTITANDISTNTATLKSLTFSSSGSSLIDNDGIVTAYQMTIPDTQGANGTVMTNDGAGNLYWGTGGSSLDFPLQAPDDSLTTPSYSWENNPSMGLYRIANNEMGFSIDGTNLISLTSNDFTIDSRTNVTIGGDLHVSGSEFIADVTTYEVQDPLVLFGKDNATDNNNLGFNLQYNDGVDKWSGLIRDRTTKDFYLFQNASSQPTETLATLPSIDSAVLHTGGLYLRDSSIDKKVKLLASNSTVTDFELIMPPELAAGSLVNNGLGVLAFSSDVSSVSIINNLEANTIDGNPVEFEIEQQDFTSITSANVYTCPEGTTSIHIKMWGAAGGGSNYNNGNPRSGGGSGGYTYTEFPAAPGDIFYTTVGEGGKSGGGVGGNVGDNGIGGDGAIQSNWRSGAGGSYSAIHKFDITTQQYTLIACAGGGGGAGSDSSVATLKGGGGNGGTGTIGSGTAFGGQGGANGNGGAGGNGGTGAIGSDYNSLTQSSLFMFDGAGSTGGGGGGGSGGGGYGGGGGGYNRAGGGGGGGYTDALGSNSSIESSNTFEPPQNTDTDRTGSTNPTAGTSSSTNGNNGLIIIKSFGSTFDSQVLSCAANNNISLENNNNDASIKILSNGTLSINSTHTSLSSTNSLNAFINGNIKQSISSDFTSITNSLLLSNEEDAFVKLPNLTTDPSTTFDGSMYYDRINHTFKGLANGSWVTFATI
jgi:hypothetical protein